MIRHLKTIVGAVLTLSSFLAAPLAQADSTTLSTSVAQPLHGQPAIAAVSTQVTPGVPAPGTLWSAAYYFDARSKTSASVVAYQVKSITGIFGHANWALDLSTFAGYNLNNSSFVSGWELGRTFTLANGVWFTAGVAVSVEANHPIGAGAIFGLKVQF